MGQFLVIFKINDENVKDVIGDDKDYLLVVFRENIIRRLFFMEMKVEDKCRFFLKCKSFYFEKSIVFFLNIQCLNSNCEVLVVLQSDNCSFDVFNRNFLDVNVLYFVLLIDIYNVFMNMMIFLNFKIFDRMCFFLRNFIVLV